MIQAVEEVDESNFGTKYVADLPNFKTDRKSRKLRREKHRGDENDNL